VRPAYAMRPASLAAALGVEFQWRADQAILDGSNNVIGVQNLRGPDTLQLGTGSAALGPLVTDAKFNGQPTVQFTGTQWLDSTALKASFNYINKSNCQIVHVFSVDNVTGDKTVGSTGYGQNGHNDGITGTQTYVTLWADSGLVVNDTYNANLVANTPTVWDVRCKKGELFEFSQTVNRKWKALATIGGLSTTPAVYTYRIGAQAQNNTAAGNKPLVGRWAETLIIPRVMGEYETQLLRDYFFDRYGTVTFPLDDLSSTILRLEPFSWTRPDFVTNVSNLLDSYQDVATVGLNWTHNYSYKTPPPVAEPLLNNQLAATFTAIQYYEVVTKASFLCDGSGMEVWAGFLPTSFAQDQYFLAQMYGVAMEFLITATGLLRLNIRTATSSYAVSASSPSPLVLNQPVFVGCYYQEGRPGNEWALYIRSTQVASGNSTTPPAVPGVNQYVLIGAHDEQVNNSLRGKLTDVVIFKRVLTDAERGVMPAYFAGRYAMAT